jgi:hypothetical protein
MCVSQDEQLSTSAVVGDLDFKHFNTKNNHTTLNENTTVPWLFEKYKPVHQISQNASGKIFKKYNHY